MMKKIGTDPDMAQVLEKSRRPYPSKDDDEQSKKIWMQPEMKQQSEQQRPEERPRSLRQVPQQTQPKKPEL